MNDLSSSLATVAKMPVVRGHYSQLIVQPNGSYQMAGQKAWDPVTGVLISGDMRQQVEQIFANIRAILQAHDLSLESITRISCHLANIADYDEFNACYTTCLGDSLPTRIVLGGYQLREGALIEMCADGHVERRGAAQ